MVTNLHTINVLCFIVVKIWFIMVKYTVYRGKYKVCRGILQSGNFWYIIMSKLSHSKSTTWYETAYRDIQ